MQTRSNERMCIEHKVIKNIKKLKEEQAILCHKQNVKNMNPNNVHSRNGHTNLN